MGCSGVFIGSDFKNIRRYKELEVPPQGEWVDFDIDLDRQHPEGGWVWNSGCHVAARIDRQKYLVRVHTNSLLLGRLPACNRQQFTSSQFFPQPGTGIASRGDRLAACALRDISHS